jgi:hypothetical protein
MIKRLWELKLRRFLEKQSLQIVDIEKTVFLGRFTALSCIARRKSRFASKLNAACKEYYDNPSSVLRTMILYRFIHPFYYVRYHYRTLMKRLMILLLGKDKSKKIADSVRKIYDTRRKR